MAKRARRPRRDELLAALLEGAPHPLADELAAWLADSRRFAAFAAAHLPKVRKKLRAPGDREDLGDLRLELETARLLLRERALSLRYEPPGEGRGPDFEVAFTTRFAFGVEVARVRPAAAGPLAGAALDGRLADVVVRKLGQLLPDRANVLLVGVDAPPPDEPAVRAAMLAAQRRAEAGDPALVGRHGLQGRGDFFRRYRRLSAVLVRGTPLRAADPLVLWDNPQAERPLPSEVRTALVRSHGP